MALSGFRNICSSRRKGIWCFLRFAKGDSNISVALLALRANRSIGSAAGKSALAKRGTIVYHVVKRAQIYFGFYTVLFRMRRSCLPARGLSIIIRYLSVFKCGLLGSRIFNGGRAGLSVRNLLGELKLFAITSKSGRCVRQPEKHLHLQL